MQKIINLMLAMGYPIEAKGVCAGLNQMWQQAFLSGGQAEEFKFFERLDKINTLYSQRTITKDNIVSKLAEVEHKAQLKIDLTEEDEFLLEMNAFFDGVCIYQAGYKPEIADNIFEGQVVTQHSLDILSSVAASEALEEHGGIAEVFSQPVVYSNNQLQGFFDDLAHELQSEEMTNLTFSLSSGMHRIGIRYHQDENKWSIIDPGNNLDQNLAYKRDREGNAISLAEAVQNNIKIPHEHIAKMLRGGGLSFVENSVFNIKAITTKDNAHIEAIKNKFERFRTKNLDALTEDQVKLSNRGITLTSQAIQHNHFDFLQKSAQKFPEAFKNNITIPTTDYGQLSLSSAYDLRRNDMVKLLCKNGALKLQTDDGNTEIMARVNDNDLDFLSYISRVVEAADFTEDDLAFLRESANKEVLQIEFLKYIEYKNANNEPIPLEELVNFKNNLAIKSNNLFIEQIIKKLPDNHPFMEEIKREKLLQSIEGQISRLQWSQYNPFLADPKAKIAALEQLKIDLNAADIKTQKVEDILTNWENKKAINTITKEEVTFAQLMSLKRNIFRESSFSTEKDPTTTQKMFLDFKNRYKTTTDDPQQNDLVENQDNDENRIKI